MANTKSAIKRMRQNPKRRLRNRYYVGVARAFVRKARTGLVGTSLEEARRATMEAVGALDQAASKGILHKNNAARRKSRLMSNLARLEKQA